MAHYPAEKTALGPPIADGLAVCGRALCGRSTSLGDLAAERDGAFGRHAALALALGACWSGPCIVALTLVVRDGAHRVQDLDHLDERSLITGVGVRPPSRMRTAASVLMDRRYQTQPLISATVQLIQAKALTVDPAPGGARRKGEEPVYLSHSVEGTLEQVDYGAHGSAHHASEDWVPTAG